MIFWKAEIWHKYSFYILPPVPGDVATFTLPQMCSLPGSPFDRPESAAMHLILGVLSILQVTCELSSMRPCTQLTVRFICVEWEKKMNSLLFNVVNWWRSLEPSVRTIRLALTWWFMLWKNNKNSLALPRCSRDRCSQQGGDSCLYPNT